MKIIKLLAVLLLILCITNPAWALRAAYVGDGVNKGATGYDVRAYGVTGDGVTDDRATLATADTAANSAGVSLVLPNGDYKISSDITLVSNLVFHPGAILTPDTGDTVTINGIIDAGQYQIFAGDGTIAGSPKNDFVRPEWWGAVSDGATDCQAAFELAINFAYANGVGQVKLSSGIYYINSTTTFTSIREVTIVGTTTKPQYTSSRVAGSAIVFNGIATGTPGWRFDSCSGLSFENFWMYTVGTKAHSGIYFYQTRTSVFKGINVQRFTTASVYFDDSFSLTFKDCTFSASAAGVRSFGNTQNITFLGCSLIQNTSCGAQVYGQNYTFIGCDFEGQPRGIDQNPGTGRVNSRGWLVEGNYFESMGLDNVLFLVFNDYGQFGTAYLSDLDYFIYLNSSDHNVVVNWAGDVKIQAASTNNTIVHIGGTVTDDGTDTIILDDMNATVIDIDGNHLRKDGTVALTTDWPTGEYLITTGDMGVTKTAANYGDELVTNGAFDSDAVGWAVAVSVLTSEASGQSGNCLKVLSTGGGGGWQAQARQEVTVIPFVKHKLTYYYKQGDSTKGRVYIDDSAFYRGNPGVGDLYYSGNLTDVAWAEHTAEFTPTTSPVYLMLENFDTGAYSFFDEVSITIILAGDLSVGNDINAGGDITAGGVVTAGDIVVTKTAANYGDELVTNGTFETDPTTNWTAVVATLTSEAGGQSNNCLKNLSTGGGTGYRSQARQEVAVIPNLKHRLSYYYKQGDGTYSRVWIDDTAFSRDPTTGDLYNSGFLTDATWTEHTVIFTPTTTPVYVILENFDTGAYSFFDEFSITTILAGDLSVGNDAVIGNDLTVTNDLTVDEKTIFTPTTTQVINAVGDVILASGRIVVLDPDADYILTSAPTIADGTEGEVVYIICASGETNTVTIQDQDYLASSNIQLLGNVASRGVTGEGVILLYFNGTDWIEYGGSGSGGAINITMPLQADDAIHIGQGGIHLSNQLPATAASTQTGIDIVVQANLQDPTSRYHAIDVAVSGGVPGGEVAAVGTHTDVEVIIQDIGTFVNMDWGGVWTGAAFADKTTEFTTAGAGGANDIELFPADDDYILIADANTFSELEVILYSVGSIDAKLDFFYGDGSQGWTPYNPADDTEGMTESGIIRWTAGDLTAWGTDTVNEITGLGGGVEYYWVKIVRTRNNVVTDAVESTLEILAPTIYKWDKNGNLTVNNIIVNDTVVTGSFAGITAAEVVDINIGSIPSNNPNIRRVLVYISNDPTGDENILCRLSFHETDAFTSTGEIVAYEFNVTFTETNGGVTAGDATDVVDTTAGLVIHDLIYFQGGTPEFQRLTAAPTATGIAFADTAAEDHANDTGIVRVAVIPDSFWLEDGDGSNEIHARLETFSAPNAAMNIAISIDL